MIKIAIKLLKRVYWRNYSFFGPFFIRTITKIKNYRYRLRKEKINYKNIPIIINNFNRLEYLIKLTNSLTTRGYNNIYIIDNNSTYPPLLNFYKHCKFKVIYLGYNGGFKALWENKIFKEFKKSYYIYTDSDLEIKKECPEDFVLRMMELLNKYPYCQKVGLALSIEDLPETYEYRDKVIQHEQKFWLKQLEPDVYDALVDTTFALYRPFCSGPATPIKQNIRLAGKYTIRHLPWYTNSKSPSEEEQFYIELLRQNKTIATSWYRKKD